MIWCGIITHQRDLLIYVAIAFVLLLVVMESFEK